MEEKEKNDFQSCCLVPSWFLSLCLSFVESLRACTHVGFVFCLCWCLAQLTVFSCPELFHSTWKPKYCHTHGSNSSKAFFCLNTSVVHMTHHSVHACHVKGGGEDPIGHYYKQLITTHSKKKIFRWLLKAGGGSQVMWHLKQQSRCLEKYDGWMGPQNTHVFLQRRHPVCFPCKTDKSSLFFFWFFLSLTIPQP